MNCVECGRDKTAKWYSPKTNPTCCSCYRKAYVAKNKDAVKQYYSQYNATDKAKKARLAYEKTEKGRAARKKAERGYYYRNPDKMKAKVNTEAQRERLKNHYRKNKPYYHAKSVVRGRQLKNASLKGKYAEQTLEVYKRRKPHEEVDHIVPINHPDICGLHVPWNLQLLPKKENRAKRNKWEQNEILQQ